VALPQLGILASGSGSNFEAIAEAIEAGDLAAQIRVLICNQPQAKVLERADRLEVPSVVLDHRQIKPRQVLDQAIVETLRAYQVDWVVMAGWMRLVTPVLIDAYPGRILNIHPSLLPSFPGLHAVEQALAYGVKVSGCTVHVVTPEMDSGPIVAQAAVPVLDTDTPETLHARIQVQEHRLIVASIRQLTTSN
jgi:phosphoribosylglycinamide formyltransferase-1